MKVNANCPCKRLQCGFHGDCEACKEHHRTVNTKYLTACDRMRIKEEKKARQKAGEKKSVPDSDY